MESKLSGFDKNGSLKQNSREAFTDAVNTCEYNVKTESHDSVSLKH